MSKDKHIQAKIGDFIGKRAKAKFKSNVEFANVCNVNESTIRRVLAGKQNLTIKILEQICEALEIKISDLFKEVDR